MHAKAAPPPLTEEQRRVRTGRRRLLSYTAFFVLVALAAGGVWIYRSVLPYRAAERVREGATLMVPGRFQEAVDKFNEALQVDPTRTDVYARRGMAYQNLGRMDLALEDFERALLVDSRQPAVLTSRGILYRSRGEFRKAVGEFTKSLALREDTDTYFERAQAHQLMDENREALADLDKVVAALRDAPHALRARAALKLKLGDQLGSQEDLASARAFETRSTRATTETKE